MVQGSKPRMEMQARDGGRSGTVRGQHVAVGDAPREEHAGASHQRKEDTRERSGRKRRQVKKSARRPHRFLGANVCRRSFLFLRMEPSSLTEHYPTPCPFRDAPRSLLRKHWYTKGPFFNLFSERTTDNHMKDDHLPSCLLVSQGQLFVRLSSRPPSAATCAASYGCLCVLIYCFRR
ncbi:hypothetical protein TRVL_06304 [Trypanosoma vivax]|nr:hypothetical protein TRVL_06304 [Trypanosoma vivax]